MHCVCLMFVHVVFIFFSNTAGLRTIAVSEVPIMVDRSPPLAGRVYDGAMVGSDVDFQSNATTLCVIFEGFSDPESGIASITWTAGRSSLYEALIVNDAHKRIVIDFTGLTVGDVRIVSRELTPSEIVSRVACEDGLNPMLNHNTTYYSSLTVYNGAMNSQSVSVSSDNGGMCYRMDYVTNPCYTVWILCTAE